VIGKKNELLGIDIGASSIKLVYLTPKKSKGKRTFELKSIGMVPLPREAIVEGTIMDAYAVSDALMQLVTEAKVKAKNAAIALPGHAVMVRRVMISAANPQELEENINFEIKHNTPFKPEEVQVDYHVLPSESAEQMEVILVIAKREKIGEFTSVVEQAGLTPVVVDISPFAVYNAFEFNYEPFISNVVAIVHVGATSTEFVVARNGAPLFVRTKETGGDFITESIQKEFGVSFEKAEDLKKGEISEGITPETLSSIYEMVYNDLAAELTRTVEFFSGQFGVLELERIYISGGGALMQGIGDFFEERFNLPVEYLNPFRNILYNEKAFSREIVETNAPLFTVATGLAMRSIGG